MSATEIFEIRRRNLTQLLDYWIAGQQFKTGKEICEHYGLDATYIAQLLNSKRQMSRQAAREVEQKLQLPLEWLDQVVAEMVEVAQQSTALECYAMDIIEQQLFRTKLLGQALIHLAQIDPHFQGYMLQVSQMCNHSILKPNWYLLLQKKVIPQSQDLVCIQLENQMALMLYYDRQQSKDLHFYTLDDQRPLQFHQDDIIAIDVVQALLAPQQVQVISLK